MNKQKTKHLISRLGLHHPVTPVNLNVEDPVDFPALNQDTVLILSAFCELLRHEGSHVHVLGSLRSGQQC